MSCAGKLQGILYAQAMVNIYCKSRNLPNTDTKNYSTDTLDKDFQIKEGL